MTAGSTKGGAGEADAADAFAGDGFPLPRPVSAAGPSPAPPYTDEPWAAEPQPEGEQDGRRPGGERPYGAYGGAGEGELPYAQGRFGRTRDGGGAAVRAARRRVGGAASVPLVLADVLATAAAVFGCTGADAGVWLAGPACCAVWLLCVRAGLYRPCLDPHALEELPPLTARVVVAWCAAVALLSVSGLAAVPGPLAVLAGPPGNALLACAARACVHGLRRNRRRTRPRSALVVGCGGTARAVAAALAERSRYGLHPVGLVAAPAPARAAPRPEAESGAESDAESGAESDAEPDRERNAEPAAEPERAPGPAGALPVLCTPEEVARAVAEHGVRDAVFVRTPWEDPQLAALAGLLGDRGVAGWLVRPGCALGAHGTHAAAASGTAGAAGRGTSAHVWGFACRPLPLTCPRPRATWRKRLLDLALVAPALVAAAPLLAACALAVRVADGPCVLFRQERVGKDGRPFTLLKFRTVRPVDDRESATRWTVAGDARMSRVGALLRRTSLDELPQLWNVLRGDMSLVGPRPERPYFVRQFSRHHPGYAHRHRAPAGITGLAQVHGLRGDTSIEDRARFDNHYIETWSLWQDVRIMCRTATSFFRLEGR